MDYPIVFPADQRDFSGLGLAVLKEAGNVKIRQVINGEYTLSLMLPVKTPPWQYIKEENIIYVEKQAFRIRRFEEVRDNTGKLISNIQCEHISYDLNDLKHLPKMRDIVNVTPEQVFKTGFNDSDGKHINGILNGTDFLFTSENVGSTDLFLSKTTPRAVLNEFLNALECEVIFDNFSISVVAKRGRREKEVVFSTDLNVPEIKRTTDSSGLCTRLYPYGSNYLDITSVNSGVAYLDSPLINNYDYVHEDYRDYSDIEVPAKLKEKALKEWSDGERDGIDKPKLTYELSVLELKKAVGYSKFKEFELGDTIIVKDKPLNIDITARIMEYEYYPYEAQRSNVVLSNFKPNIGGVFADITKNQNIIKQITNKKGEVNDEFIESVRQTTSMRFNEALTKKTIVYDYANMWVDDMENPKSAIALVDGMFAMANSRTPDGKWNWRTLGNSNGLVADSVISNWVYAGKIQANQIDAGTINTDKIAISSSQGNLKILSNKIEITANDDTKLILGGGNHGLKYQHSFHPNGQVSEETAINRFGIVKYLYDDKGNGTFGRYVEAATCGMAGGGTSPQVLPYHLPSPEWCLRGDEDSRKVHAIVSPAEKIRFMNPSGGYVNDIIDYTCTVQSTRYDSTGTWVYVESWKRYVSRIISGNSFESSTGSLKFNICVILC